MEGGWGLGPTDPALSKEAEARRGELGEWSLAELGRLRWSRSGLATWGQRQLRSLAFAFNFKLRPSGRGSVPHTSCDPVQEGPDVRHHTNDKGPCQSHRVPNCPQRGHHPRGPSLPPEPPKHRSLPRTSLSVSSPRPRVEQTSVTNNVPLSQCTTPAVSQGPHPHSRTRTRASENVAVDPRSRLPPPPPAQDVSREDWGTQVSPDPNHS